MTASKADRLYRSYDVKAAMPDSPTSGTPGENEIDGHKPTTVIDDRVGHVVAMQVRWMQMLTLGKQLPCAQRVQRVNAPQEVEIRTI